MPYLFFNGLKGAGKTKLFFEVSERRIRYLTECLWDDNLSMLEVSDAGQFRDFLFERGMSSSSVKRIFSSIRAIVNSAIREQCIAVNNLFSGTYIVDNEMKQKRSPIPMGNPRQVQSNFRSLND